MDWAALSVLTAVVLGAVGYLSRHITRQVDRLDGRIDRLDGRFDRIDARFDQLEERYVRHLEAHAAGR